jgi:hypothetical protein
MDCQNIIRYVWYAAKLVTSHEVACKHLLDVHGVANVCFHCIYKYITES